MHEKCLIQAAVVKDSATVELPNIRALAAKVQAGGPRRLDAIGELVKEHAGDEATAELYLDELIARTQRQVKGQQALYKTFTNRVDGLEDEVLQALPDTTRAALYALVRLAKKKPIPVSDPRLFAHSLCIDGELSQYLRRGGWRDVLDVPTDAGPDQVRQAYQRIRREHHPDHGGDADQFRAVQIAWKQAQEELRHEP